MRVIKFIAVTSDGTLIQKSGIITGGVSGIEGKAQRWDEKKIDEHKKRRDKLYVELTEITHKLRSISTEENLTTEITSLSNKIKYAEIDLVLWLFNYHL